MQVSSRKRTRWVRLPTISAQSQSVFHASEDDALSFLNPDTGTQFPAEDTGTAYIVTGPTKCMHQSYPTPENSAYTGRGRYSL